jgi:ketosteroid isomerase-like protein
MRSVSSSPVRFLFLAAQLWAASQAGGRFPDPDDSNGPPSAKQGRLSSQTSLRTTPKEKGARDLVKSWCSAYRQSDPERLAALEMTEVEIVDRFGDWHHLTGRRDRERFWREGLDMIRTKDFRPECSIEHARLIRPDVAIVQARISYDRGIGLKGSDRIPPFCEIHTFVLTKSHDAWLISAQDIVQQISLK